MFRRRRSAAAVLEHELSEAGSKAAETVGELAERALTIAREAGHVATPAIRTATHHSVEGLSRAAERASEALADTADRLAKTGEVRAADAAHIARIRLADASEKLAEAVRPRPPKRHRVRRILIVTAVVGGVVALVRSPLRSKITERLFGPPPDDEPGSITLPYGEAEDTAQENIEIHAEPAPPPPSASEGNGVSSQPTSEPADTTRT